MYRDNWAANDKLEVFVHTTQTSGMYLVKITAGGQQFTQQITITK